MIKDEKTCYNCGNKNCNIYYSMVKKDYKRHFETYEYNDFDCMNHNKWEKLKVEEIRTDNKETLKNALGRIAELEAQIETQTNYAKLYHQEVIALQSQLKACKDKYAGLKTRCIELFLQNNEFADYLTKAKEIIRDQKELLDRVLSGAETLSDFAQNTLRKAEQFIKE